MLASELPGLICHPRLQRGQHARRPAKVAQHAGCRGGQGGGAGVRCRVVKRRPQGATCERTCSGGHRASDPPTSKLGHPPASAPHRSSFRALAALNSCGASAISAARLSASMRRRAVLIARGSTNITTGEQQKAESLAHRQSRWRAAAPAAAATAGAAAGAPAELLFSGQASTVQGRAQHFQHLASGRQLRTPAAGAACRPQLPRHGLLCRRLWQGCRRAHQKNEHPGSPAGAVVHLPARCLASLLPSAAEPQWHRPGRRSLPQRGGSCWAAAAPQGRAAAIKRRQFQARLTHQLYAPAPTRPATHHGSMQVQDKGSGICTDGAAQAHGAWGQQDADAAELHPAGRHGGMQRSSSTSCMLGQGFCT